MMGSVGTRRLLLSRLASRVRFPAPPSRCRLSTVATPLPPPPPPIPSVEPQSWSQVPPPIPSVEPQSWSQVPPPPPRASSSQKTSEEGADTHQRAGGAGPRSRAAGDYKEEEARVLRAALLHVTRLGWSESAMIAGARDAGLSPSIVGAFPRKEAALVEFFMDDCLQRLIDHIDSGDGEELKNLILSERLSKLIRMRLEMQAPYISKWPQALSIQSQPMNLSTSLKQRALLVDEIWHAAGDVGADIDWYVKRTVLGGIYSTSEVYMVTDNSPEFNDTWKFVENRVKDALDLQKTIQEAAYLAEAVGAGMGSSMQGLLKRVFQG